MTLISKRRDRARNKAELRRQESIAAAPTLDDCRKLMLDAMPSRTDEEREACAKLYHDFILKWVSHHPIYDMSEHAIFGERA
jgi:hypothetical protein